MHRRWVVAAALIVAAAGLPLVISPTSAAFTDMVLGAAYVVMALGLNIVVGFAGLLDLGYVAFVAIGAYTAAYLASTYWADAAGGHGVAVLTSGLAAHLPGIHVNFLLVLAAAAGATMVAGTLIGVPTLRLRGDYVAIVTLAFGEIIARVVANGDEIHVLGGSLTDGPNNIGPIDPIALPLLGSFSAVDPRPWYWFALAMVAAALLVAVRLRDSRLGRAWSALRQDELAAAAAGIPIARTKLVAYAVSAAFGGVSGAFVASYLAAVNADQFQFSFSLFIFSMVVLGGVGSVRGVVLGALALSALNSYLLPDVLYGLPGRLGLDFDLSAVASGVYGVLIMLVMLLRPAGLLPPALRQADTRRPL